MSPRFVEVSSEKLEGFLVSKGFRRDVQSHEVIYIRDHHIDSNVKVKVYTTLSVGARQARSCGSDAIRVVTIFDNGRGKSFGVGKFPKLLRTAPAGLSDEARVQVLLDRLYERMREAYARANEFVKESKARFANR
jgi:hypothetical protein